MNWYEYAGNNPIMFIDPLGLERLDEDDINSLRQQQQVVIAEQEETIDIYVTLTFSGSPDSVIPGSNETYREACIRGIKESWMGEFEYKYVNVYIDDVSTDNPNNYMATDIFVDSNMGISNTSWDFSTPIVDKIEPSNYAITIYSGDNRNNYTYTDQDIAYVAGHEFGHTLGIGDLYDVPQFQNSVSMMNNQWIAKTAQCCDYMMMFMARNQGAYLMFSSKQDPQNFS